MLLTTVILSITLASVFAFNVSETNAISKTENNISFPLGEAEAAPSGAKHDIMMEAVKMPDGMYAYRMVEYEMTTERGNNDDDAEEKRTKVRDLVKAGIYSTDPQIPGPTLVFTEGDTVNVTLKNNACEDNFVNGGVGAFENSRVGIHVHGVHYDISDDATYKRMNMSDELSAATCGDKVEYKWDIGLGTEGTWPYHDHTFSQNEVGAEDIGLFGTVIVNPHDGKVNGLVDSQTGNIQNVKVDNIDKEFVLWMVSSEVLGRSVFYGMEIDNAHPDTPGKQTALWVNPPLYASDGDIVRYHVLGLGDETHAFHLHGHRWVDAQGGTADIIDVKEITPLQRHTFLVEVSDNGNEHDGTSEGWMYHCHVFSHMQAGMSGMMHVVKGDDTLPEVGAVFTLSDEPGLWMKTLNAGIGDDLDEVLASVGALPEEDTRAGTGFPLDYLGKALGSGFDDSEGRSLAVINPGESVLFNMKDSQTKHTITTLIYPTDADPLGGNGILTKDLKIGHYDTQLGIRGSAILSDANGKPAALEEPGLYVFVCKIHPYMFSAVIVDDPTTNVFSNTLNAPLPLLDLSDSLTVLTRTGSLDDSQFPTVIPPTDPLALELLKDFYVITDPSNWKDYDIESGMHIVNLPPVLVTTNTEDIVVGLHANEDNVLDLAEALGITKSNGEPPATLVTGLALDSEMPIGEVSPPSTPGVGEVWVNTQFERTIGKNHLGTPFDKPGTITVVDTSDWSIEKKISLPEINMNHPHNMWTDTKNEVIYQTQWFDTKMAVIDRESGELIKNEFVGQSPSHVMTSPETGKIYIAMNGEEQVNEIDPVTLEVTKQISTGPRSHPHGHWISSDGTTMVTPDFLGLSSSIIDLNTGDSEKAIGTHGNLFDGTPVLLGPIATGMMGSGEKYYTADFLGNTLSVIDTNTKEITHQINLLESEVPTGLPIQTPVSPDDKWVVTANVIAARIAVIDTSTDTIVANLPCDPGCHGVQWGAKDNGGYYAYVSSKFSNALIVVDPDPDGNGDGTDAEVAGKIVLTEKFNTQTDDRVMDYAGMGGQGVLAIPNVYNGWIDKTVLECGETADPCSQEIVDFLDLLTNDQRQAKSKFVAASLSVIADSNDESDPEPTTDPEPKS